MRIHKIALGYWVFCLSIALGMALFFGGKPIQWFAVSIYSAFTIVWIIIVKKAERND